LLQSAGRGEAVHASPRPRVQAAGAWPLALVVAALALLRLALAARIPVVDDEAYYWIWSRHLALSYLDHPPLVAWLDAAATAAGRAEWLLRLPAVAATAGATAFVYLLGRDLFGRTAGVRAAALHLAAPVFALQGLLAIPDPLLYACWAGAMWTCWRAAASHAPGRAPGWWALTGAALGCGLLSKYTMLLWLPVPLVLLARPSRPSPLSRPRLCRTPGPSLAAAIAVALAAPVVVWNAQHHWASVRFWLHAGGPGGPPAGGAPPPGAGGWRFIHEALAQCAVQFGYAGPLAFPLMAWAVGRSARLGRADERYAFLAAAAIPTALAVLSADLAGFYRPNWLAPAFLAGAVAAGGLSPRRWLRAAVASGLALSLAAASFVLAAPSLPPALRWDELYGWRQVTAEMVRRAAAIATHGDALPAGNRAPRPVVLLGQRYNQAAYFGYYTGDRVPVTTGRLSEFSFFAPPHRFAGWQALAALDSREPVGDLTSDCARLAEMAPYQVAFPGGGARRFRLFRCVGYRGTPAPP
jgi:4-amino-4-deoxy-L-arabinose transferase-like glycosyltransferase